MPQTTLARGNELYDWIISVPAVTWSGTVGATSAAELTFTLSGINVGDVVASMDYTPPTGTAVTTAMPFGLSGQNYRVTATNTIGVLWNNSTAGALTPPTGPWLMNIVRPENPSALPPTAA